MCNTLKHPRHNKPNWESFPSSTAYKEIFERWRPTFNKQKLTLDWSKNTSLKKVFATDIVHNLKFLGLCMQEWKRKKNCENEKRKKNVGGNKTTGWRSLSKTGWRTDALRLTGDVASGCGRLWFPDSSLKGLTSDASQHPCLHPSIHLFIHPSLPLSFLFAFGVNKFCFPLDPLEGPWSSHLFIQRDVRRRVKKHKEIKKKMHETLLTFRTLNLVKASVRMKGQTEVRAGKKLHVLPTGPSRQKTTDVDEKDALKVERWSLLQRKYVMNEMRWKKWIYFSPPVNDDVTFTFIIFWIIKKIFIFSYFEKTVTSCANRFELHVRLQFCWNDENLRDYSNRFML